MNPSTSRSADYWKRKTALALNVDPGLSDTDLDKAHDEHMIALNQLLAEEGDNGSMIHKGMPPGPASVTANSSSQTRMALARALMNEQKAKGMSHDDAYHFVCNTRPELFQAKGSVHR